MVLSRALCVLKYFINFYAQTSAIKKCNKKLAFLRIFSIRGSFSICRRLHLKCCFHRLRSISDLMYDDFFLNTRGNTLKAKSLFFLYVSCRWTCDMKINFRSNRVSQSSFNVMLEFIFLYTLIQLQFNKIHCTYK